MRRDREKRIEDFLAENPYLIDESLRDLIPLKQETLGSNRTDLTFRREDLLTIVEIKRIGLKCEDLAQLRGYMDAYGKENELSEYHYLIGKKAKDPDGFKRKALENRIRVLYLGRDIPTAFLYDTRNRAYVPFSETKARAARYDGEFRLRL